MASTTQNTGISSSGRIRLTHLAAETLLDSMQQSVKRMDAYISNEVSKAAGSVKSPEKKTAPGTSGNMSSGRYADVKSVKSHPTKPLAKAQSNSLSDCPVDLKVVQKAATDMMEARNYIKRTLRNEVYPFLMKHVIARAVNDKPIHLVRLAINDRVEVLDFRSLEIWITTGMHSDTGLVGGKDMTASHESLAERPINADEVSQNSLTLTSRSIMGNKSTKVGPVTATKKLSTSSLDLFTPPNEFDWFSRDKMGKILSMSEACELFSIIGIAECADNLKELYVNATRFTYYPALVESLTTISRTISSLSYLSKLVLRGMCDDEILRAIGESLKQLTYLDVSGSQYVTDVGLQKLFFQDLTQNSALYLISSWISKNLDKMNSCINTLVYLDYSWTSVTALGRKMVQLLPGCYLFKRLMSSRGENDSFGHHIFIRQMPCLSEIIPATMDNVHKKLLERHVSRFVSGRGVQDFVKLIEHHPWKNCQLNLYSENILNTKSGSLSSTDNPKDSKTFFGIIIPNANERRIQGTLQWTNDTLSHVYTIYPVNINNLGMFTHLKLFRGILYEVWRMSSSLLPQLAHLDTFAEPRTLVTILESCPSLRRLRVRIRGKSIIDDDVIKTIQACMCRRTLEDLWIAPGTLVEPFQTKPTLGKQTERKASKAAESLSTRPVSPWQDPSSNLKPNSMEPVLLSLGCIEALIQSCPKLKRLGDISTWSLVDEEELYLFCEGLKQKKSTLLIIWANMNLPDYAK